MNNAEIDQLLKHTLAIFDDKQLLTGSYNWTRGAAQYNEENFIVTEDARLMRSFVRVFQALWDKLT